MSRDQFYQKIVEGLAGELDEKIFEKCAVAVLQDLYPRLVPISGGNDSGMDGSLVNKEGEQIVLVCTTSADVIGNLDKNLKEYIEKCKQGRKAILVTSRVLNAQKRSNLFDKAKQLDFILVEIHDGSDFANRLYNNPRWCKVLLGVSGNPDALSTIPKSTRISANIPLTGRDIDIEWLSGIKEDALLVGQPGSGKTCLLQGLVKQERALYLVSDDMDKFADSYREFKPSIIIIDDSDPANSVIRNLIHYRMVSNANFILVASCWPNKMDELRELLNISRQAIHTLKLLTSEQIGEVVETYTATRNLSLVPIWLNEIVRQAEGRPGLAITLTNSLLSGNLVEVASGKQLLTSSFVGIDRISKPALAVIALSGNAGCSLVYAAKVLEIDQGTLQVILYDCSAAGLLFISNDKKMISVHPKILRYALVREEFFESIPLSIQKVIDILGHDYINVEVLLGARARGARIPDEYIIPILDNGYHNYWVDYASLGVREAKYVLSNQPEKLLEIAGVSIDRIPYEVIPLLLTTAVNDKRLLDPNPLAPLRIIRDWIAAALPGTDDFVKRRTLLLNITIKWLRDGGDIVTGVKALEFTMALNYENTLQTYIPNQIQIQQGLATVSDINKIAILWEKIKETYRDYECSNWTPVDNIVCHWLNAHMAFGINISDEVKAVLNSYGSKMLSDFLLLSKGDLNARYRILRIAQDNHINLDIATCDAFDTIFPVETRHGDWKQKETEHIEEINRLAVNWCNEDPEIIARKLVDYEAVVSKLEHCWPRYEGVLCEKLAQLSENPQLWSEAFLKNHLPIAFIVPFLSRSVILGIGTWQEHALFCLRDPNPEYIVPFILSLENPPTLLLENALSLAPRALGLIQQSIAWNKVPISVLQMLLNHPVLAVRSGVTECIWHRYKNEIPIELYQGWRNAVIGSECDFWLETILKTNAE